MEAGLRTDDRFQPFPEELNRLVTTQIASVHFAATEGAANNLLREGVERSRIHVTATPASMPCCTYRMGWSAGCFGHGLEEICSAFATLAARSDVQMILPVHPNPHVRAIVERLMGSLRSVSVIDPLEYVSFVDLMRRAHILITDSGGIQEEAPSLGKPVLVVRNKTERPEAVQAGTVKLVGRTMTGL